MGTRVKPFILGLLSVAAFAAAPGQGQAPGAQTPDIPVMADRSLPFAQEKPLLLPDGSRAQQEKNKQLVPDCYRLVGDRNDWSDDNVSKYIAPDFINHSTKEPSPKRPMPHSCAS